MQTIDTNQSAPRHGPNVATVVDLFCGAGGLAHGFLNEGFAIAAGIDLDPACEYPFKHNNHAAFLNRDVDKLTGADLASLFPSAGHKVLVGCAPCQPFSTYNPRGRGAGKYALVDKFADLISESEPDVVSMENVPKLLTFNRKELISSFRAKLQERGYHVTAKIVPVMKYGLPQTRRRLVVLASRLGPIEIEKPDPDSPIRTVRDEIGNLPAIGAGDRDPTDSLHHARALSDMNMKRIEASKPGGTWADWDPSLIAECHKRENGQTFRNVYGRMAWDEPSPTITTLFHGFGNGRFGHPEQHRALSLREGAMLQSFPRHYEFVAPGEKVAMHNVARLIGNAVPVTLGRVIARSVRRHLTIYSR